MGVEAWTRHLCLDTDVREQAADGGLAGYSDNEFVHLSMAPVKTVLADPAKHPLLRERFDLDDPKIHAQLLNLAGKNLQQAGQQRINGALAFNANIPAVRAKFAAHVRDLQNRWAEVKNQKNGDGQVRLEDRFSVLMIGSACGGTFSSFCIDLAAEIKRQIKDPNLDMSLTLFLADVFESVLAGKDAEWERVKANSHSCLVEVDGVCNGWAQQQKVKIGRSEAEATQIPAGLWNRIDLVSRRDSDGNDLETPQAVCETVAQSLGAEIALSIGGKISSLQMNDVARQGLNHCPDTKLPRSFSTLNSAALVLPKKRLLKNATDKQLVAMYQTVIGGGVSLDESVSGWLLQVELEERSNGVNPPTACLRATAPTAEDLLRPLSRQKRHKGRHKNRQYGPLYLSAREKFQDVDLPEIEAVMQVERGKLADKASCQLAEKIDCLVSNKGLRPAREWLTLLKAEIADIGKDQKEQIRNELVGAKKSDEAANVMVAKFFTWFGRFGRTERRQIYVESCFRRFIGLSLSCLCRQQTLKLLSELAGHINRECDQLDLEIRGAETELARLVKILEPHGEPDFVVGDNAAEIDITPTDFCFYEENKLQPLTLLGGLRVCETQSMGDMIRSCGIDPGKVTSSATRLAASHFGDALKKINVCDVLGHVLATPGPAAELAKTKIRVALAKTNPLWSAELSRVDESFADFTVMGFPTVTGKYGKLVTDCLVKEAAAVMNKNPLYQGSANVIQTVDPLRIHICRRTHGARLFYLRDWPTLKNAARKWKEKGAIPTSVFPQKWRDTMPPQEPRAEASRTDLGFAVAIAYGFISRRGKWYARNLILQERSGVCKYVVPFTSHATSIAFENQKPKALRPGAALATFVAAGRIIFSGREDVDARVRLGNGRDKALDAFRKDEQFCDEVYAAFDALCEVAGNIHVAQELEEYLLLGTCQTASAKYYDQLTEEQELLAGLMQELSMQG